jgi:hypothetical protein
MKNFLLLCCLTCMMSGNIFAAVYTFELSPAAGDALSNVNYANGDHVLGIAAPNAVGQPASNATGDAIVDGVTYDDATGILSYNIGYGSDFGFVDLVEDFTIAHVHGEVAVQFPSPNTGVGVIFGLNHIAGASALTGSFVGAAPLSPSQATDLLANLYYVNIHSTFAVGGEIRGQLVATSVIPEPSMLLGLASMGSGLLCVRRRRS